MGLPHGALLAVSGVRASGASFVEVKGFGRILRTSWHVYGVNEWRVINDQGGREYVRHLGKFTSFKAALLHAQECRKEIASA